MIMNKCNLRYTHENMINKNKILKFGSLNSNTDFDKDNEEESEKLNKSNTFIEYANKFVNNLIVNDSFNNLKINEYGQNNQNNENLSGNNYINETNNNINNEKIYNNDINNNFIESFDNNISFLISLFLFFYKIFFIKV